MQDPSLSLHPALSGAPAAAWRARARGFLWSWFVRALSLAGRLVDLALCIPLLIVLGPILRIAFVVAFAAGGGLRRREYVGRHGKPFRLYSFHFGRRRAPGWFCRLPVLLNILLGHMSLIGPRPLTPEEAPRSDPRFWRRSMVRPGVVSLFWVRQRTNIAFDCELTTDAQYADAKSVRGDLGIALRAAPAALYGGDAVELRDRISILGVEVWNLTLQESIEEIARSSDAETPRQVCFVNADCINIAYRDPEYFETLERAGLVLPDGIGLKVAGRLLRRPIRQNVNGTDLFPRLCAELDRAGKSVYLLGGRPGVAEAVAGWIAARHPGLRVSGVRHGYFTPEEEPGVVEEVARSGAALLLVALGVPRQDLWIRRNLERLNVGAAMGVGGLFDFYSGRIPRAPQWLREIGLEWIYRFLQEPRRMWRRYFVGNFLFLCRVARERYGLSLPSHITHTRSGAKS